MEDHASDTSTATMDRDALVDRIGDMLGEDLIGKRQTEPVETPGLEPTAAQPEPPPEPTPQPVQTYEVPKSWKREMHEHWGKVSPEAQAYIIEREKQLLDGFQTFRPIQDALTPYQDYLSRRGASPAQAVAALLAAERRLTEGTIEQRRAAYQELGRNLKLLDDAIQQQQNGQPQTPVDPAVQTLQQRLDAMEQQVRAERDAKINQIRTENQKAVDAFAADTKAHPYFDEVANEIAILVSQGYSLQDAYDKAVWMNPVTAEKEKARLLTEAEAKWKENARLAALPKKKAASVNIQSDRDGPEPTEPVGTLEDTIKSELKKIRARA